MNGLGMSDLERAGALALMGAQIAVLTERVDTLEERAIEDRAEIGKLKDAVGSLRNFQAWIMAGIAILGAILGKALDPIIDKVFK